MLSSALALTLTGCIDNDDNNVNPTYPALVSIYHASPNAPDFDIYLNNQKINTQPFKYSSYSGYFQVAPSSQRFKFTQTNATTALIDTAITFQQDKFYTLFAIDELQELDVLVVKDSLVAPDAGKASVRFVHLSPDAPAVEVSTSTGSTTPAFVMEAGFKGSTAYKTLPANTYTFEVKNAATDEDVLSVQNISLSAGKIYTFVLRGYDTPPAENNNNLNLQVLTNY